MNYAASSEIRVGTGYDSHRLEAGRPLILGGVEISGELGFVGHSDADVLTHAVIDALLGAAGLGDIGSHFPDTDEQWRDADSLDLAARTVALLHERGWRIVNVDATVILEEPRITERRDTIRASLATALSIESGVVSVKATTNEGIGAIGRGEGGAAIAVALIARADGH